MGLWSEDKLDQKHIAHSSHTDAQQGVPLPDMQQSNDGAAQDLRKAKGRCQEIHILQAVDHQHAHDGVGKYLTQIFDDGRDLPVPAENQEGRKPGGGGDKCGHSDDEDGVEVIHGRHLLRIS